MPHSLVLMLLYLDLPNVVQFNVSNDADEDWFPPNSRRSNKKAKPLSNQASSASFLGRGTTPKVSNNG